MNYPTKIFRSDHILLSHWVPYVLWPLIPLYWSHKNLVDCLADLHVHPTKNMIYLPGRSSNIAIENRGTWWNMNIFCHFIKNPSADCADFPVISTMSLWFIPWKILKLSKKFCVSHENSHEITVSHEIDPWNHHYPYDSPSLNTSKLGVSRKIPACPANSPLRMPRWRCLWKTARCSEAGALGPWGQGGPKNHGNGSGNSLCEHWTCAQSCYQTEKCWLKHV